MNVNPDESSRKRFIDEAREQCRRRDPHSVFHVWNEMFSEPRETTHREENPGQWNTRLEDFDVSKSLVSRLRRPKALDTAKKKERDGKGQGQGQGPFYTQTKYSPRLDGINNKLAAAGAAGTTILGGAAGLLTGARGQLHLLAGGAF